MTKVEVVEVVELEDAEMDDVVEVLDDEDVNVVVDVNADGEAGGFSVDLG